MTPWVTRRGMPAPGMARPAEPPELARPPRRSGAFARLATQSPRSRRDAAAIGRFRTARPDASTLPYPARPAFRWLLGSPVRVRTTGAMRSLPSGVGDLCPDACALLGRAVDVEATVESLDAGRKA